MNGRFATAINCIDGRVQIPVIEWLKNQYHVDYVNLVTEPGPDALLAAGTDETAINSIRHRVELSIIRRNAELIAVVGHYDCAANPVDEDAHLKQILAAVATVEAWYLNREVIGVWVDKDGRVRRIK